MKKRIGINYPLSILEVRRPPLKKDKGSDGSDVLIFIQTADAIRIKTPLPFAFAFCKGKSKGR